MILNEKSLEGQFADLDEFCDTLPTMSRNFKVLQNLGITLWKHSTLFTRNVTKEATILDLRNSKGIVNPTQRDKVTKWKRELSLLTMMPPFWDTEESESGDSVEEAARRNMDVLSFQHPQYQDVALDVLVLGKTVTINSAVTTEYLIDLLFRKRKMDKLSYLKERFRNGRLVLDYLDVETDSVADLEKSEFNELIVALERFEKTTSWGEIQQDNFFYYKSYQPSSKKQNYFLTSEFRNKSIDKFRCGKHSQVRCFGYREEEKFYLLLIERDHSVSDTG